MKMLLHSEFITATPKYVNQVFDFKWLYRQPSAVCTREVTPPRGYVVLDVSRHQVLLHLQRLHLAPPELREAGIHKDGKRVGCTKYLAK
jgi:hypothetical protein